MSKRKKIVFAVLFAFGLLLGFTAKMLNDDDKIKILIISGHTDKYHDWELMSSTIEDVLKEAKVFKVKTLLMKEGKDFNPDFEKYDAVVMNLDEVSWSFQTKSSFEKYMAYGGGMVVVHEANNAFPEWGEYNRMTGLGGWGGRNEKDGPYLYFDGVRYVKDPSPGIAGTHGSKEPFEIVIRDHNHIITSGLPKSWMHYDDELYSNLRGPAELTQVLATAYSDPATGGSGKHEPVAFTVRYGHGDRGRIFHLPLGHTSKTHTAAVENKGFRVLLSRGTEWAATGKVRQQAPDSL